MSKKVKSIINPVIKNSVKLLQKTYSGKQDPALLKKYMGVMSKQFSQSAVKLKALEKNASPVTLDKSKKEVKSYLNKTTNFVKRVIAASSKKVTGPIKLTESVLLEAKKRTNSDLENRLRILKNLLSEKFKIKITKKLEKNLEKEIKKQGFLSFYNAADIAGIKLPSSGAGLERLAKKQGLHKAVANEYNEKLGKELRKRYKRKTISDKEIKKLSEKEKRKEARSKGAYKDKDKGKEKVRQERRKKAEQKAANTTTPESNATSTSTTASSSSVTSGANSVRTSRSKEAETTDYKKEETKRIKYINKLKGFLASKITNSNTPSGKRDRDALKNFDDFLRTNPTQAEIKQEFKRTVLSIEKNNIAAKAEKAEKKARENLKNAQWEMARADKLAENAARRNDRKAELAAKAAADKAREKVRLAERAADKAERAAYEAKKDAQWATNRADRQAENAERRKEKADERASRARKAAFEDAVEEVKAEVEAQGGDLKGVENTISALVKQGAPHQVIVNEVMSILKKNQPVDPPNTFLPFGIKAGVKGGLKPANGSASSMGVEFTNYLQKMIYYFLQSYRGVIRSKTSNLQGLVVDMQKSLKKKNAKPDKKVKEVIAKLEALKKEMASETVTDKNLKKFELQYAKYYDYLKRHSGGNLEDYGNLEKEKKNSMFMAKLSSMLGKIMGYIVYAVKYAILYIKRLLVLFKTHILVGLSIIAALAIAVYVFIVVGKKQEKGIEQEEEEDVRSLDAAAKMFKVSSLVLSSLSKKV